MLNMVEWHNLDCVRITIFGVHFGKKFYTHFLSLFRPSFTINANLNTHNVINAVQLSSSAANRIYAVLISSYLYPCCHQTAAGLICVCSICSL